MKKIIIFAALFILFTGCAKPSEKKLNSSNSEFNVELLFTVDSINVYRFNDAGYYIYFTNAIGKTHYTHVTSTGKVTTFHPIDVENN